LSRGTTGNVISASSRLIPSRGTTGNVISASSRLIPSRGATPIPTNIPSKLLPQGFIAKKPIGSNLRMRGNRI